MSTLDRDSYIDALRAVAIVRVVLYHLTYAGWLAVAFPSMGVMFALGGWFAASSMQQRGLRTILHRLSRVLPSFWALGIVVVPTSLLIYAFTPDSSQATAIGLLSWIFPVADPNGFAGNDVLWRPLWYLRAYVWFILLTPVLMLLVRRYPWTTVGSVLAALVLLTPETISRLYDSGPLGPVGVDLLTYGACWSIGMAAQLGALSRISKRTAASAALVLALIGAWQFVVRSRELGSVDVYGSPAGNAWWSAAYVLVMLRFRPAARTLASLPRVATILRRLSSRSLTIYLWHGVAIAAVTVALDAPFIRPVVQASWTPSALVWLLFGTALTTCLAVAAAGRIEDRARVRT